MDACTIIAKNYVAQARVLARSFAQHHPDGRFWVLIIDDFVGYIDPSVEPFDVLTPSDVGCDPFEDMAVRYNVLELSTAVKPWLLSHLMREVSGPVTYLDPDIRVFGSLEDLADLARAHGVVLTPHNTAPIPDDGRRPSQIDIMIAGVYNLGYVSMAPSEEIEKLLGWWSDRLRRDCRVDPVYGYFVDQRWFDLAPGFVSDYAVMREPQYNVAYWNLHSRALRKEGDSYTVDDRPLGFFHFSGFDPESPSILSRHQNRVDVRDNPAIAAILEEYAAATIEEGYGTTKRWPYTFDALPGGTRLDPVARKLYIDAVDRGELSLSPFTADGHRAFLEWLGAPQADAPAGVHRLLAHLYGSRADLRQAFPDLDGPDLGRLLHWSRNDGSEEVPILAQVPLPEGAQDALDAAPTPRRQREAPWGVNVVGYFRSELGVGEAARQVIGALDAVEVPTLAIQAETRHLSRQGHAFSQLRLEDADLPLNLICINADMLPEFARRAGEHFLKARYTIGMWFWEVSQFPAQWQASFEFVDEVWAPTPHVADALVRVSPVPVVPMTVPVQVPAIVPRSRIDLGVPDGFLFLFSFDYLSVFERKNPLAVIDAFSRAFSPGDGASLVLKCINAEHDQVNHARLLAAAGAHPDIQVVDRYLDSTDKDALTANCDCYVSLHRSEGFGLTMAEAMYLGKPVIATGYSGNLDFMTDDNSLLVDHDLVAIGPDAAPYPPEGEWAEPSCEHAAELMRALFDDRAAAAALGGRAAEDIRRTHSPSAAGERMKQRLVYVSAHHPARSARGATNGVISPSVSELAAQVQRGPLPAASSKRGPLASSARRGTLRVMRPFTAYQESVNAEIANALGSVEQVLTDLHDRAIGTNAMVLARLRSQEELKTLPNVIAAHSAAIDWVKDTLTQLGGQVDDFGRAHQLETDRTVYTALSLLAERHRSISAQPAGAHADTALAPYELRVFSQNGEDGVLAEILTRVGTGERFFVEFGVESGREGNCVSLADVFGWSGLFLDCDEIFFPQLERKYRANDAVRTMRAMVTPENVEELFAQCGVPAEPAVLSIDVDGGDYWIWEAIASYRPRVLVIEYNSALDPTRRLVQPREHAEGWDGTDYFGASLGAIKSLGEVKGYRFVYAELSGVNAFFVREDLADGRFPSVDELAAPGQPNYFQQGRGHPPAAGDRRYLDLESGELVTVA